MAKNRPDRSKLRLHNSVCFHCQQCSEEYLKALLEEQELDDSQARTILTVLRKLLLPNYPSIFAGWRRGLLFLTSFAVGVRYPGPNADAGGSCFAVGHTRAHHYAGTFLGLIPELPGTFRQSELPFSAGFCYPLSSTPLVGEGESMQWLLIATGFTGALTLVFLLRRAHGFFFPPAQTRAVFFHPKGAARTLSSAS